MRQFFENEKEHNIMCLTETRQKTNTIAIPDNFYRFTAMRQDKKASKRGGLQILGTKNKSVDWRQIETGGNKDILVIEGKCFNIKMRIILVYFDVNKRLETTQAGENVKLRNEVEKAMRENRMEGMLILGDMNGHLRIIEEDRRDDINGRMIMDWIKEEELFLLNSNEKCKGKYTWGREREEVQDSMRAKPMNREVP